MRILVLLCSLIATAPIQAQMASDLLPVENSIYTAPTFTGGESELFQFLAQRLEYPSLAQEYNVEGMVVARLQLNKEGKIQSSSIVKSLGFGCDESVLAMIDQMPNWQPARYGQKAEFGVVYLPVKFSLR